MKQIFAYTDPRMADADRYVEFMQAFKSDDGYVFAIRDSAGKTNSIVVSQMIVDSLVKSLTSEVPA